MTTPFFNPGARDDFDGSGAGSFDGWLPVEFGDEAIQRIVEMSVVERRARTEPMRENTKTVPRFTNFTVGNVAKGEQYTLSDSYEDQITLEAKKVGGAKRLAEEDLRDLVADPLASSRLEAVDALSINYDNSCLAVTGAVGPDVKYRSVYAAVRAAPDGFDTEFGYAANDNYEAISPSNFTAPTTATTNGYDTLSDALGKLETGRFHDPGNTVVIAEHAVMGLLRKIKDANGQPAMTQNGVDFRGRPVYDLFGYPIEFTRGARTSPTDSQAPSGNPLVIFANRMVLLRGTRALSPQIPANTFGVALQRSMVGPGFLSDEAYFKAAFRRAFNVATALGVSVVEIDPTA